MPDTDDADYCVYCGQVLLDPPDCCNAALAEYKEDQEARWRELEKREQEVYD